MPRRSRLFDVALAAVLSLAGIAELVVPLSSRQGHGSLPVACLAVSVRGVAVAARRTAPMASFGVVLVSLVVGSLLGDHYVLFYGQAVVLGVGLYALARYASRPHVLIGLALAVVTFLGADLTVPELGHPSEIVFHWSAAVLVVVAAMSMRRWARRAAESQRQAIETEVAAAERAMAAVLDERARIARELHDIVAHAVSTIVVQAGAAEQVVHEDPELVRRSLDAIRTTGRSALGEMRRLVAVLRDDDEVGPLTPQPGLEGLPQLVEAMTSSGLAVELVVGGETPALPAGLDLAVFRIVQEGLTNARRHSTAGRAEVRLSFGPEAVGIAVWDPGPPRVAADSGGHGLVGVRERVQLYGGTFAAGPDDSGGYLLRACLAVTP